MTEQVTFHRQVTPVAPPLPVGSELFGFEYRSFQIVRENPNYMLWDIKTKTGGEPPPRLRGSFTTRQKAIEEVDSFLEDESRKVRNED